MRKSSHGRPLRVLFLVVSLVAIYQVRLSAQNPIIRNQFSADPSARVFNGKVYVYPSHDILAQEGKGRPGWFCMEDYHVFSSTDMTDWTDHGVIVSQEKVPWANPKGYAMWAPDCIYRNGKYYFYFPAPAGDTAYGRGFSIGVAIADKPEGPFIPQPTPIKGVHGIDPNPFIDKDGQAYLYWAGGRIFGAKLKENMVELASEPQVIGEIPNKGLVEGPYLFERNGLYYMTYPHVANKIERLEYAIASNPLGPFKYGGVVMDESPMNCWTNHQSFIEFNGQWYLFYHQNAYSPRFDKNRSICTDSLFFNADGTMQKVIPSLRGVGITGATKNIEIDRYSSKSENGVEISFLDSLQPFKGWKTTLSSKNAWIQYNKVDFGNKKLKTLGVQLMAPDGGTLQVFCDSRQGKMLAEVNIPSSTEWKNQQVKLSNFLPGDHNIVLMLKSDKPVEVDWIKFGF